MSAELIPFPHRDDEDVSASVPVDRPPTADEVLIGRVLQSATADRRPIIPGWLRSRADFWSALRRVLFLQAHRLAYHAVRLPLYAARTTLRAPRGAWTVTTWTTGKVFDREGAPLRYDAARRGAADDYLKLIRARNDRVRLRLLVLGGVLLALLLTAVAVRVFAPDDAGWLVLAVAIAALGWIGSTPDKPLLDRAVISAGAPKLTSNVVVEALGALGLAGISQAIAKNPSFAIVFPAPITRDGPGYRAEVDLPLGITVGDVAERRERLATGLRRPLGCVWPEGRPEIHPGRLVVWVGDQDVTKVKQPAWPLLKRGGVDLFQPFPLGTDPRGRTVPLELMYTNVLIGSIPGYGKTMTLRVPLLAAALDPRAELWTYELKGSGDLEALGKVAHRYAAGGDDDVLEEVLLSLRDLLAECRRRADKIKRLPKDLRPENKVTPQLANRRGLHPLVVAIDECQELFGNKQFGAEAGDLAERIIKLGRAFGVILLLATQRPDKDSLPTGITANVGTRLALRVTDQTTNDMILGTSAYRQGIRATMFGPSDKGVAYLRGAGEPVIVRGFYVDAVAAERVCDRARALREQAGTLGGYALDGQNTERAPTINLLDDVAAVLEPGEDAVWSELLCQRLAELRPGTYTGWTADALARALKPLGVTTGQIGRRVDGEVVNRRGITVAELTAARQARQLPGPDSSQPANR